MSHRALVVAAGRDELPHLDREASAVADCLHGYIFPEPITVQRLVDHVGNRLYSVIWIAGHGKDIGVPMADGGIASAADISDICNMAEADDLVLNVCLSINLITQIQLMTAVGILFVTGEVNDKDASMIGVAIARQVKRGKSFDEALRITPRAHGAYGYIPRKASSPQKVKAMGEDGKLWDMIHEAHTDNLLLRQRLTHLETQFSTLIIKVDALTDELRTSSGDRTSRLLVVGVFLVAGMLFALAIGALGIMRLIGG